MVDHSRLGRGLASLMGEVAEESPVADVSRKPRKAPIENLVANPRNPRRAFTEAELVELTASIKERGIIQPIVVRAVRGADGFEIVAGERRWRAAQRAGLHEVPIVTLDVSDSDALEIAIVENVQRSDLNPMEEAQGYHALAADFKRSPEDIARIVGKSRSHVANMMRLTRLPADVQALIAEGKLSAGHARALVNVADPSAAARRVIAEGLSVRQTEALAHEEGVPERPHKPRGGKAAAKDADTLALEKRIGDILGLTVSVDHRDPGGTVHIKYRDLDQLDDILRRLEAGR